MSSNPQESSNRLRYIRAKLQPLARPELWGAGVALSMLMAVIWQYVQNPNFLDEITAEVGSAPTNINDPDSIVNNSEFASELATDGEEQGYQFVEQLIEDNDSSSLFGEAAILGTSEGDQEGETQQNQAQATDNLFTESVKAFSNRNLKGLLPKVVSNDPSNSSILGSSGANSNFLSLGNNPTGVPQESALQKAIDRLGSDNSSRFNSDTNGDNEAQENLAGTEADNPRQVQSNPNLFRQPTNNNLFNQGTSSFNPLPNIPNAPVQSQQIPRNSFDVLTRPSAANIAPIPLNNAPVNSPVDPRFQSNYNYRQVPQSTYQPQPVAPSGYTSYQINQGLQQNQFNQPINQPINQPNFTAPRQIPGNYIGGGQINTFSNP